MGMGVSHGGLHGSDMRSQRGGQRQTQRGEARAHLCELSTDGSGHWFSLSCCRPVSGPHLGTITSMPQSLLSQEVSVKPSAHILPPLLPQWGPPVLWHVTHSSGGGSASGSAPAAPGRR